MALRKRGVTFLICFRKRGVPRKGRGFPQKRRIPTMEETKYIYIERERERERERENGYFVGTIIGYDGSS